MLETLFFKSYYAYLRGNFSECKLYYEFFKSEYKEHPNRNALNKYQVIELKKIIESVKIGKLIKYDDTLESYIDTKIPTTTSEQKQPEIVKHIHYDAFNHLSSILDAREGFHLANIEHPCPPYGAVDMFYLDSETAYPLEVKKDRGEHDLIGQIQKYDLFFKLQLHLKFYFKVQPVTVCGSYDPYTLMELKKKGVITLRYSIKDKLLLEIL